MYIRKCAAERKAPLEAAGLFRYHRLMKKLLDLPASARPGREEFFEILVGGASGLRVERIISQGQTTPEGLWYNQEQDEWVLVLEGEARLEYENGAKIALGRGDSLFLPRHVKHRVAYTSAPCIWLAIHGDLRREY